jgi:hypothetical protein
MLLLLFVLLLALSAIRESNGHPRNMLLADNCERVIAAGATIMARAAVSSISSAVTVTRVSDC